MKTGEFSQKFKWPLVGNGHIIDFLGSSIENQKIAHCYIFLGPAELGKATLASYFSQSLLCQEERKGAPKPCGSCKSCQSWESWRESKKDYSSLPHGDFHFLERDSENNKKNISVEQVREFIRELGMSSFLGSYKIGIIKDADSLSMEAANSLLKTLEEPNDKVVIILIASGLESIPATIVSRSQVLNFNLVPANTIYDYLLKERETSRSAAMNFSHLSSGRPALALKLMEDKDFYEDYMNKADIFLECLSGGVNGRIKSVESLFGRNAAAEPVKTASSIIQIWQSLIRDLMLIQLGQVDLLKNQPLTAKLNELKNKFSLKELVKLFGNFKKSEEFLKANVNPKLVIENLVIQL